MSEELRRDLEALAEIGIDPAGGMTRLALSEADARARAYVRGRMEELGLTTYADEVGNLFGRREGTGAPVMTGSHLDTVPRGGRYDGPLGVVGGLEALRLLDRWGVRAGRPIEVAVFVGEEGSRFGRGTIGSAALSGDVPVDAILALRDKQGMSFAEALRTYGDGQARPARREPGAVHAFVELHIEQGGVLEANGCEIGAVTAIAGLVQLVIVCEGDANHAGATPMDLRRDALCAAAELALAAERVAREVGGGAVATTGQLVVEPGAFNIIPGRVTMGIDARAVEPARLDRLDHELRAAAAAIGARRRVGVSVAARQRVEPGPLDERVIGAVDRGAASEGLRSHRMLSGAIHDALHLAGYAPSGMIFVPSKGGKSHCPEEETGLTEMQRGCAVLARVLAELSAS